ncbi:MAG: hypothetical protein KC561_04370 [Myxococcales bacterium]|nr:hypothetical protein [Myxococcales bacterium]
MDARNEKYRLGLVLSMLLVFGASCGGANTRVGPPTSPFSRAAETVRSAIRAGLEAELNVDEIEFLARFNPAPCDCPDWEIRYRGDWIRVWLVAEEYPTEAALEQLEATALSDIQRGELLTYPIVGSVTDQTVLSRTTGLRYRRLILAPVSE